MVPCSLTIAGSDPSGGAGLQADLKTFHQFHSYGMSVVTLLTVQNTKSVELVRVMDPDFVLQQLKAVLSDIPPHAAKTGALGSAEVVDALSMRAESFNFPLVLDPVMISKHGSPLLDPDAVRVLKRQLMPFAYLATPNIPEAEQLSERNISDIAGMERAAVTISKLGAKSVLIKGGHLQDEATDVLYYDKQFVRFPAARVDTPHTHGTGCVFSAVITAQLARQVGLIQAVKTAKSYIHRAIETSPQLGQGNGPVNFFAVVS